MYSELPYVDRFQMSNTFLFFRFLGFLLWVYCDFVASLLTRISILFFIFKYKYHLSSKINFCSNIQTMVSLITCLPYIPCLCGDWSVLQRIWLKSITCFNFVELLLKNFPFSILISRIRFFCLLKSIF